MTLKAFIFDVDGTLADTEEAHRQAFNLAFKQAGLPWHWDYHLYKQLLSVTGGKERIQYFTKDFLPDYQPPENFTQIVTDLHAAKTRFYVDLMQSGKVPLRCGVQNLFAAARQAGILLAIATTTTPANITALLESTLGKGAEKQFATIAAGDMVKAKKPAPDVYLLALQQLGLRADECLAFEDSRNGLLSAKGAGLKTLITTNPFTDDHDFSQADLVLDQLGDAQHPFRVIDAKGRDLGGFTHVNLELATRLLES